MVQESIDALLQEKIGLATGIINVREIARAVETRRRACNLPDLYAYWQRLQTSSLELEELIERVIVPETWFFRDSKPFAFLVDRVASIVPRQKHRPLRLLSVPCSSGEEPYSMAMALLDAGLIPSQFCIDAVDISKQSLAKAKRGVYYRNSFRGSNLEFRQRYFTQVGDGYELSDLVKNTVNFMQGNLLDPCLLKAKQPYDAIFCRNVLIYFDNAAREKTIQTLERLLADRGLLFVGHAETSQLLESRFTSVRSPIAFAYQKKELQQYLDTNQSSRFLQPSKPKAETKKPATQGVNLGTKRPQCTRVSVTPAQTLAPQVASSTQLPNCSLAVARSLADKGQLDEAASLCETYIKKHFTDVEAYVLLGQIHQARGLEQDAEQSFQRALYLKPDRYEALMHLALLKEHRGDTTAAKILRQRIQRLEKKPSF